MHIRQASEPWAPLFKDGVILWRAGSFQSDGSFEPCSLKGFEKTEKGNHIGRVNIGQSFSWEPEIIPSTWYDERNGEMAHSRGFVLFMEGDLTENWTHAIITGVSYAMKQPVEISDGRPIHRGCIFAKIAQPYDMGDYRKFRTRLFNVYRENMNNPSFQEVVETCLKIWPKGYRPGDCRLLAKMWSGEYAHIRIKEEATKEKEKTNA